MGSEAPRRVTIHVSGFKKFHGVAQNPTETIVNNLKTYVEKRGLAPSVTLGSCEVLEAAGDGALPTLYKVMESGILGEVDSSTEQVVWLHLGVNSGLVIFAIEQQAVNEATFRCPDELGWQPQQLPIVVADGGISRTRQGRSPGLLELYLKMKLGSNIKQFFLGDREVNYSVIWTLEQSEALNFYCSVA